MPVMAAMGRLWPLRVESGRLRSVAAQHSWEHICPRGDDGVAYPENIPRDAKGGSAAPTWLGRVTEVVRNRDGIGIAIEVAVVTLGVLIAFQIDQWGQDQRQAREERQFLERMYSETDEAIRENDWAVQIHARNRRTAIEGLKRANDNVALARFAATPESCLTGASFPGLGFNDTSYEELSASGRLNIVSDPVLRAELREVAAAQAEAVTQLNYSRAQGIPITQTLDPYVNLGFDQDGNRTCRTDWPALVKDHAARNAVVRYARYLVLVWQKRAYTRDVLAKAHNHIACKLGKPDCLARVPQIIGYRPRNDVLPPALSRKAMSPTGK